MLIQPARADDVESYLALFEAVASEGVWFGAEAPVDLAKVRSLAEAAMADPGAALFVACKDSVVAGSVYLRADNGVVGLGMMVESTLRRQGVGRRLLAAGVTWAVDVGAVHKMTLEVWPHNGSAIALYRHAGFVIEGRLRRHHRRRSGELWDSLVMGLLLDQSSPGSPHHDSVGLHKGENHTSA